MKRKLFLLIIMSAICLTACGKSAETTSTKASNEGPTSIAASEDENLPEISEVMDRVLADISLADAKEYEDGLTDTASDQIYLLSRTESGTFELYGFVSPEYGTKGLMINYIIDGEDNWNLFYDDWYFGTDSPSLVEDGEDLILTIYQFDDEEIKEQSVTLNYFETGTVDSVTGATEGYLF